MAEQTTPERAIAAARAAIARAGDAYRAASAAVEAIPDPDQAFRVATELTRALRAVTDAHGRVRQQIAVRVYEVSDLALAALGERYEMSKQQMGALVQAGRRVGDPGDEPATREDDDGK